MLYLRLLHLWEARVVLDRSAVHPGGGWCPAALLSAKDRVLFKTLLMVSLVPVPYLAGLALLLKRPIVLSLGGCIALAAIADLWCLYGVCRRIPGRPWRATGVGLLVLLPMPFVVTALVAIFSAPGRSGGPLFGSVQCRHHGAAGPGMLLGRMLGRRGQNEDRFSPRAGPAGGRPGPGGQSISQYGLPGTF